MARRLSRYLPVIVPALLVVALLATIMIASRSGWARQRLHEAIARELADYFKREVAVGPVTLTLPHSASIDGLAIAEGKALRDGAVITAERLRVDFDLWSVIRGRAAPLASISAINVWGLRVRAVRDAQGRLNLRDILPPPRLLPPDRRFRGRVLVHDGAVAFYDYDRSVRAAPAVVRVAGLQGNADFARVLSVAGTLRGRLLDGRAGPLAVRLLADLDGPFLNLDLSLSDLDIAWVLAHYAPRGDVAVTGGRVDIGGSLYRVSYLGKKQQDFSMSARLRGVSAVARQLGPEPGVVTGTLWAGADGVQTQGLQLRFGGTTYEVTGSLSNFHHPTLDVALASDAARLGPLLQAVPEKYRSALSLPAGGNGSLFAQVIGPSDNPDLRLRLNLRDSFTFKLAQLGTIRAEGLTATADVVGVTNPVVQATVTARGLQAALKKDLPGLPEALRGSALGPMENLTAKVSLCGGQPVAQATIAAPYLRLGKMTLAHLSTEATLTGDLLRLHNLKAQALGGLITADASALVSHPELGLRARGSVRGVDLARLRELPVKLPSALTGLAGAASADFQGNVTGKDFIGEANFTAANVVTDKLSMAAAKGALAIERNGQLSGAGRIAAVGLLSKDLKIDRAEALLSFRGDEVTILSGNAQGASGLLWARGNVNTTSKQLDLQVWTAELAMQPVMTYIGLKEVAGTGYLAGRITGTAKTPIFQGHITMFDADIASYSFAALSSDVAYQPGTLGLGDFMASRGGSVIGGGITLGNLRAPGPQRTVQGSLRGQRVDLREVAQMLKRDIPLEGLAEFTADLSGSLQDPRVQGTLRLANASYQDYVVARADIPFEMASKRLSVTGGRAMMLDAPLQFGGSVLLDKTPVVDAKLSAGRLHLEGLAPFLKANLPIAGSATIEDMWVRGPTDGLEGGGRLRADEVTIGDETISHVDATFALARGQVELRDTSFAAAGGHMLLSGTYDTAADSHTITAHVKLQQTGLRDLGFLALPFVSALDKRPAAERDRLRLDLRSTALRLEGNLEGDITVEGPITDPTAVVDLRGQKLVLDGKALPGLAVAARVTKDQLEDVALRLHQGDALVTASGALAFDGLINMTVDGSGISMTQLRPWFPLDIAYGGQLGFTVVAQGSSHRPDLTASIDVTDPSFAGVQFDLLSVPVATVREGQIDVDTLILKRGEKEIVLDGQLPFSWSLPVERDGQTTHRPGLIPDGQITMGGRIENTPLAFFLPLIDEYQRARGSASSEPGAAGGSRWASMKTEGQLNSTVSLLGTVREPTLRGEVKMERGLIQPVGWKAPLTDLNADLRFTGTGRDNLVEVRALGGKYQELQSDLTGRFWLNQTGRGDFWRNPFDLRLSLQAPRATLVTGTDVTDLKGVLTFRTEEGVQVLRPEAFGFKLGGGEAALTGEARLKDLRLAELAHNQWDLHLAVNKARLLASPYLNARLSGGLDLTTPAGARQARLSGQWVLDDGLLGLIAPPAGPTALRALSSRYPSPNLDVTVAIGPDVRLRGSGVNAPLDPNPSAVRIEGTPQRPKISGTVVSRHGTTALPTSTMRLNELMVTYALEPVPADRNDPVQLRLRGEVQGSAETSISRPDASSIRIKVRISGGLPDQVRISTTSDPPLSESQIYALLGGVPFGQLPGVGGGEGNLGQVLSEQFLATLATAFRVRVFQPIEEQLKKALGLSEFGITFTFNQPVTLQVGKYLLENLLVTYQHPLTEGTARYDLRVSYELPAGLRITYHNDQRNINQIEIGYSFTY